MKKKVKEPKFMVRTTTKYGDIPYTMCIPEALFTEEEIIQAQLEASRAWTLKYAKLFYNKPPSDFEQSVREWTAKGFLGYKSQSLKPHK